MRTIAPIAALVMAGGLLGLQIVGATEYTEGGSLYTRASMIAAMMTLAVLPVFIEAARRSGHGFIAICLGISFAAFLAYSLPATTGRTGEIKETKAMAAQDMAALHAELASVTTALNRARPAHIAECVGAPSPLPPKGWPKCRSLIGQVLALETRQAQLERDLRAGRPAQTGDLGSDLWAWALSPLGVTAATVRKASVLSFAIGLDFVIWSLIAFTTHAWPRRIDPRWTAQTSFDDRVTEDPEPLPPTRAIDPDLKGTNIVPWAQAFQARHGRSPRLDEVRSAFPEVPKTTAWRRLKAA